MSPRPLELWLMLLLPTGPINPPLFPLCHTVLSAQRAQQLAPPQSCYAQCWHSQNSFTPSRCPSLWSPFMPPPHPLPSRLPPPWPACSLQRLRLVVGAFSFSNFSIHPIQSWARFPFFPSLPCASSYPSECTLGLRLGEISFQHVFMTESKGRVNGASVGAGLCEARTWSSCTAGVERSPLTLFYCL